MTQELAFQPIWDSILKILEQVQQNKSFSSREYQTIASQIHRFLSSSTYEQEYLRQCIRFHEDEKKRTEERNQLAQQARNQGGRVPPTTATDPYEKNESGLPGSEFYSATKAFLLGHLEQSLQDEQNLQGEDFLRFYGRIWTKYQLMSKILNGLFSTLNNNWIARQRREGRNYIQTIDVLAMVLWNQTFFERSTSVLTEKCLALIQQERDGQLIDRPLLKSVIQSYVSVGVAIAQANFRSRPEDGLSLYKQHFESEFLKVSNEYYRIKENEYRSSGVTGDYIKKVLQWFDKEKERLAAYLHSTSQEPTMKLMIETFIVPHVPEIQEEVIRLIPLENVSALLSAYKLLRLVERATNPVEIVFEAYIHSFALAEMSAICEQAMRDPKVYVEKAIEIYKKFHQILENAFGLDPGFAKHFDEGFAKFINDNAVIQRTRQPKKSAEFLARYCDLILRKGARAVPDGNVEGKLNEILTVFNYINDKDAFEKFYGKLLAKRLIDEASASYDYEEFVISRLREICGHEYTAKIFEMFQDFRISAEINAQFRRHVEGGSMRNSVDFSIMVLKSSCWPFSPCSPFELPQELTEYMQEFTAFYLHHYQGKKLIWLHQYSKCDLIFPTSERKYTLTASIYQATVLLLFNQSAFYSFDAIKTLSRIDDATLVSVLLGLIQSKILVCSELAGRNLSQLQESDLQPSHMITVSDDFRSERVKINLINPSRSAEAREDPEITRQVDEERKIHIKLALTRVMKARLQLKHQPLIQEVLSILNRRFRPEIPKIKACIDDLISSGYMRRDENERDLYHYVA